MAPELPPARLKAAGACSARLLMDSATATAHDNATALSWHMTPPGNWHFGSIPAAAHAGCLHRGGPGGKHKQPGARQQPGFPFASLTHPQPPLAMSPGSWTGSSPTWTMPTPPLQQALAVAQSVAHTLLPTLYAGDVQPNTWLLRAAAPVAGIAVLHRKVQRHKHTASAAAVQDHHPAIPQAASCKDQQHQPRHEQQLQQQLSSSCVAAGQAATEQQPGRDASRTQQAPVQQVQATQQQQHAVVDPWQSAKLLLAGALSAVVSRTCVAPLERVKMELMLKQGAGGAVATAAQVFRTEGVGGFWKGNALNLLRTAPFKAVNFCAFDTLHRALCGARGADGNWERFLAGALAGMTATLVCFPLDLVRTRLLVRSARGPYYGPGPFHTLAGILKHEGPGALYTGCLPALIGIAPAGAVFYGVYDLLKSRHLHTLSQQQQQQQEGCSSHAAAASAPHLTAMYTLLYGALAGAASELIVYPVEVVRRRMQMQSMALAHMAVTATAAAAPATTAGAAAAGRAMLAAASHGGPAKAASAAAVAAVASVAHTTLQAAAASHSALGVPAGGAVHAAGAAATAAATKGWARLVATCAAILKAEGPAGFYAGMGPNMLQVLPSAALSYYTYDTVKQLLGVRA